MFDFHQAALCFLIRILSYDPKYKDVFREVGVLEVLTNCLKQYADALKEKYDGMRVHGVYTMYSSFEIYFLRFDGQVSVSDIQAKQFQLPFFLPLLFIYSLHLVNKIA